MKALFGHKYLSQAHAVPFANYHRLATGYESIVYVDIKRFPVGLAQLEN
jgi:hypothetical protein